MKLHLQGLGVLLIQCDEKIEVEAIAAIQIPNGLNHSLLPLTHIDVAIII